MSGPSVSIDEIDVLLAPHGLMTRGVVHLDEGDGPDMAEDGKARTVVLVGHAGSSLWPAFTAWRAGQPDLGGSDPLDHWSKAVIGPVAAKLGAVAYYPSDAPYQPFQRWAIAAEGLAASPLGILVHPQFGLWHGYRAALGFSRRDATEGKGGRLAPSPCVNCFNKPCISHCPANALRGARFDHVRCRSYLATPAGQDGCVATGCAARAACPVGSAYRYDQEQVRFHMQALQIQSAED